MMPLLSRLPMPRLHFSLSMLCRWIPACAGMTKGEDDALTSYMKHRVGSNETPEDIHLPGGSHGKSKD